MSDRLERFLWPVVAAVLAAWTVAFPLTNTDIWWHLASGREILAHGLPDTDPFSVSARGVEWIDIHWLFQIGAYGVWLLGAELALVIAKLALCALGAALLVAATPREARGATVVVLVLSLFAARHLVMARPIVVSLVLLAAFFLALESYWRARDWRPLVALPLLQVLWVNTQGLHTLGVVMVAAYLSGAVAQRLVEREWHVEWRPLAAALGACVVASFVSPWGAGAALLPWKLFGRIDPDLANIYAVNVSEFVPPWQLERTAPGSTVHLTVFLIAMAVAFVAARRRLVFPHLILVVVFTGLALMANRNILLLYWVGAPILAVSLQRGLAAVQLPRAAIPGAVVCVAVAVVATRDGRLAEPAPFRVPGVSAAELAGLEGGNVFCSVRYGGYLAWRLHPHWSPYIDGRLVLRTREQFAEYLGVLDHPERFDELRARHDFTAVVLPTAFPGRYLPLVAYLIEHPSWSLLYTDGTEVSLVYDPTGSREVTLDARAAEEAIVVRTRTGAERSVAYRNLLRLLLALGDTRQAGLVLSRRGEDALLEGLVARFHYLEGDFDLAKLCAERRLAKNEDDIDSLNLLALIAVERGRQKEALGHLRRTLDLDPYDREALELVRRLEEAP